MLEKIMTKLCKGFHLRTIITKLQLHENSIQISSVLST